MNARYDYLPFGEEIGSDRGGRGSVVGYGGADSTRQKFTQKERDSESGLDYFGERYYSGPQGRFTTCDPLGSTMRAADPQTMNRYVFVLNNPLRYVDPDGLKEKDPWNQLSAEERKIITPKLVIPKGQTAQSVFNQLATVKRQDGSIDQQATTDRVITTKNFIDVAGGHTNSAVWQQIGSFDKINGVDLAEVTVKNRDAFLGALKAEGYAVNERADKWFGPHPNDSARQTTETSFDFAFHLANDDSTRLNTYFGHFDPSSVYFRKGSIDYPNVPSFLDKQVERAAAGKMHGKVHRTPTQVRDYLKRTNQAPRGER